jgi:adhesin transport system membrane fusion protein
MNRFLNELSRTGLETDSRGNPLAHWLLWSIALFVSIALLWANYATLDEVTRASGRVIPSSQIQTIQNLEGGILQEINVSIGDQVKKGAPLLRIDDTRFNSSFKENETSIDALNYRALRLEAEISEQGLKSPENLTIDQAILYQEELRLFESRKTELASAIAILREQRQQHIQAREELNRELQKLAENAALAEQELEITEPLVAKGAVSQVELLRLRMAVNEASGRLETAQLKAPSAESMIQEAEEKILERQQQFKSSAQEELTLVRAELSRLTYSKVALQDRVDRTEVRSPVDGIVNRILVTTEGAVIQPGMDLIEIVPTNDTLLVNAKVRPVDIAFIRPGQKAMVKLTAYDFAIYGGLEARLERIGADTIVDETGEHFFEIRVRTEKNYLGTELAPLPIMTGMVASVDIITGEKTVLDYLLKPVKRATANAMRER